MNINELIYETLMTNISNIVCHDKENLVFQYQNHILEYKEILEMKGSISDNISDFHQIIFLNCFDDKNNEFSFHGLTEDISDTILEYTLRYLHPLSIDEVYFYIKEKTDLINQIELISHNKLLVNGLYELSILDSDFEQTLFFNNPKENTLQDITQLHINFNPMVNVFIDTNQKGYLPCLNNFFKKSILPCKEQLMLGYYEYEKNQLDKQLIEPANKNKIKI
jgi:hypothetical protein